MGLAMNTDTNRPDPDPDDLDGLAASLDHLRLWCETEGASPQEPCAPSELTARIAAKIRASKRRPLLV
jgi:hypothetical protein